MTGTPNYYNVTFSMRNGQEFTVGMPAAVYEEFQGGYRDPKSFQTVIFKSVTGVDVGITLSEISHYRAEATAWR